MAPLRTSIVPDRLFRSSCPIRLRRRWARVQDGRLITARRHNSDRFVEKYRGKLDRKAKDEGHESIDSLKQAYQEKISELRRRAATVGPYPVAAPSNLQQSPPPAPEPQDTTTNPNPSSGSAPATPGIKPLSAYLDLDKVSTLPKKELEYIWRLRHAPDPLSLCAVIPLETYSRIQQTAKRHPQFILPLPQPDATTVDSTVAADIHFLQWTFHPPTTPTTSSPTTRTRTPSNTHTSTILLTHLASFKSHGAYAQPHTTITHHLDLADSHGLVLLNGSVVEGKSVDVQQARWLLMCLQRFYDSEVEEGSEGAGAATASGDGKKEEVMMMMMDRESDFESGKRRRRGLLEMFSSGDPGFRIEELLDEARRVG